MLSPRRKARQGIFYALIGFSLFSVGDLVIKLLAFSRFGMRAG